MISIQQNEKAYTIFVTIPFKKTKFSETPYKRDFKEFAEEVFKAYSIFYSISYRRQNESLCQ